MSRATSTTLKTRTTPPSLSHFVILNPSLRPASAQPAVDTHTRTDEAVDESQPSSTEDVQHNADHPPLPPPVPEDRDKDLEDDLREAAQILFYTSRSSSSVSRDTMLKQTGLVKGLMGFTDMLLPPSKASRAAGRSTEEEGAQGTEEQTEPEPFLSIRSSKGRLIVYTPEEGFYVCVGITLAMSIAEDGSKEVLPNAQGLSDRVLVHGLTKGYEDFRLLHGSFASLLPATKATSTTLEKFWTKFAFAYENDNISAPPTLDSSVPEHIVPTEETSLAVRRALEVFVEDSDVPPREQPGAETGLLPTSSSEVDYRTDYGVVTRTGLLYSTNPDPALTRYLTSLVAASAPLPEVKIDARTTLGHGSRRSTADVRDRKTSWGMSMGLGMGWVPTLPGMTPRSVTPVGRDDAKSIRSVASGSEAGEGGGAGAKDAREGKDAKGKWGFGLPSLGLGEAMGSVGTVFGLGGSNVASGSIKPSPSRSHSNKPSLSSIVDSQVVAEPQPSMSRDAAEEVIGAGTALIATEEDAVRATDATTTQAGAAAERVVTDSIVTATTVNRPELGDRLESSLATEIDTLHLREPAPLAPPVMTDVQVDAEELQAAVGPETSIDLGWENRTVHLPDERGVLRKRRLTWVIRDEVLLYLLHPPLAQPPFQEPSSRAALSLYSKLGSILQPDEAKLTKEGGSSRHREANSVVHVRGGGVERTGPEVDAASSASLAEIGDVLHGNNLIREVYARTPASKFIVAKKVPPRPLQKGEPTDTASVGGHEKVQVREEVYMLVGRKDASLTDAERELDRAVSRALS